MCGIAIKYKDHTCSANKISHRGIYGKGKQFGDYLMTHYKLPLQTEPGDEFDQPIRLRNGNYLLFNGEIFNAPKEFKNDVEYLVDFFSKPNWLESIGGAEYNHWDGFWAICIVTHDKVYAFTDPLGKKQLYFRDGCISSEMKPLLSNSNKDPRFDQDEVIATSVTPFHGVSRILPNRLYWFKGTQANRSSRELFDLRRPSKDKDLVRMIHNSVEKRLINTLDQNTLFVSGGLDSTIILSHLHSLGVADDFQLLSVDNYKDSEFLSCIESYFGYKVDVIPSEPYSEDQLRKAIKVYEYPLERGSLLQQFRLCSKVKGSVIYSGDGADELFSGYSRAQIHDSQNFDVFVELPYYHHLRLDRIPMHFTKELRSPFLDHEIVRFALNCPYEYRKGKKILKELYKGSIPDEIINREKSPLREESMIRDRNSYIEKIKTTFNQINYEIN